MTPAELNLAVEGYTLYRKQQADDMIFLAWHVEILARQKKLPKLSSLIKGKQTGMDRLIDMAEKKGLKGPWKKRGEHNGNT